MTKDEIVFVDADHSHPDYQFRSTEVKTSGRSDGWFATHPKLGCGKTYPTQEEAVRGLFHDHACKNVVMRKKKMLLLAPGQWKMVDGLILENRTKNMKRVSLVIED